MKDASAPSHLGIELGQEIVSGAPEQVGRNACAGAPSPSAQDYLIVREDEILAIIS